MGEFLASAFWAALGLAGLVAANWWADRNKPSEFHLLRNAFEQHLHPGLRVRGFGDYSIRYVEHGSSVVEYAKSSRKQKRIAKQLQQNPNVSDVQLGYTSQREWEIWAGIPRP